MIQPPINEPMTEILHFKGHKFEIVTKRGEMGKYLNFHNVVEISVDGIQVLFLTDTYADFDTNKIDLLRWGSHIPAGWLDLNTLAAMLKDK